MVSDYSWGKEGGRDLPWDSSSVVSLGSEFICIAALAVHFCLGPKKMKDLGRTL